MQARLLSPLTATLLVACLPGGQTAHDPDPPGPGLIIQLTALRETTLTDGRIEREVTIRADNSRASTPADPRRIIASTRVTGGEIVEGEVITPFVNAGAIAATPDTMTFPLPASAPWPGSLQLAFYATGEDGAWHGATIGASGGTVAKPSGSAGASFGSG